MNWGRSDGDELQQRFWNLYLFLLVFTYETNSDVDTNKYGWRSTDIFLERNDVLNMSVGGQHLKIKSHSDQTA